MLGEHSMGATFFLLGCALSRSSQHCTLLCMRHNRVLNAHIVAHSASGTPLRPSPLRLQVLNLWDLRKYSHLKTVPMFESLAGATVIPRDCPLALGLGSLPGEGETTPARAGDQALIATVGERGSIRVFDTQRYVHT